MLSNRLRVAQCMRSFADNPVYTTELKGHG
jgi:hypothetical protein